MRTGVCLVKARASWGCRFIQATGRNTALVPLAWESDDRGDQSQTSHSRLQSLARRNQRPKARARVKARCQELYTYLSNTFDALINYGHRYRNGLAVSSSRAEGCVDDIGNARMGKRRRMRWSSQGAHRVAVTRAAVLDGRLTVSGIAA